MMLDSARRLMTPSARSDVPPFMVMDVMAAAARIEAAGGQVIHMEVGQPAVGAPSPAIAAVQAVLGKSALGYTESLGIPSLRARIARHYAETYGVPVSADRVIVTTGSSAGIHPGVPVDVRAGRPRRHRQSGLSAVPPHPHRARLRAGADRDRRRDALCHHRRKPARRACEEAARRRAGRKPGQSDRHHDDAAGARPI